jgi:hypothetical protein
MKQKQLECGLKKSLAEVAQKIEELSKVMAPVQFVVLRFTQT